MAMRRRYPSDSYEASKTQRLKRIRSRATVELSRAFEAGRLSLRQFDAISRRSIREQKRFVAAQRARIASALVAAATINQFLDSMETGTPLRLREVAGAISSAIRD
jgi:hypothetical protein